MQAVPGHAEFTLLAETALQSSTKETTTMQFMRNLLRRTDGATAIEYGLIAALIAVASITALQGVGNEIGTTMNTTSSVMAGPNA